MKVPFFIPSKRDDMSDRIAKAQARIDADIKAGVIDERGRMTDKGRKMQEPSAFQATAARRASRNYYEGVDDQRYRDAMFGKRSAKTGILFSLDKLDAALKMDEEVRKANGTELSEREKALRAVWRQPHQR